MVASATNTYAYANWHRNARPTAPLRYNTPMPPPPPPPTPPSPPDPPEPLDPLEPLEPLGLQPEPDDDDAQATPSQPAPLLISHGPCPVCGQKVDSLAIVCVKCGYRFDQQRRMQTETDRPTHPSGAIPSYIARRYPRHFDPDVTRFVDLDGPLLLFATGLVLAIIESASQTNSLAAFGTHLGNFLAIHLIIVTPMTILAAVGAMHMIDGSDEPAFRLLFKLGAIAFGAGAIVDGLIGTMLMWPAMSEMGIGVMMGWMVLLPIVAGIVHVPLLHHMLELENVELSVTWLAILVFRHLAWAMMTWAGFSLFG